jgi:hypothetical protein
MNTKKLSLTLIAIALLVLLALPAHAAGDVQVGLTADRAELSVGDPVLLTLAVTHPAGYKIIVPQLPPAWGPFEVRSQSPTTVEANGDGTETTRQTIEVTLFDLGEFQTPELVLTVSDGAGGLAEAAVPPVTLAVVPTLAEDDAELRDIKPQAGLAVPPAWPWVALGLLLAVAVALAGWWLVRRAKDKSFLPVPVADNRLPWQAAYDELRRIEGLDLPGQGDFKEHYSLVTDCLRAYLEAQFGLRATDRTTSELRLVLRHSDLASQHTRRFLDLFSVSDLVKFAKLTPDLAVARRLTAEARLLIDDTRPRAQDELEALLAQDQAPAAPASRFGYQSR